MKVTNFGLKKIFERVLSLIDDFHPDEVALEAPFFGKNVQSMLKLGELRAWRCQQHFQGKFPLLNMPRKA